MSQATVTGGEAGALQEGPGLVSDDADVLSVFEGGAHDAEGRAVARRSQGAGVAVGENDIVIVHAGKTVAAYGHARRDVIAPHGFGFTDEELHEVFGGEGRVPFPEGGHVVHGPGEVDGSGAGSPEIGEVLPEVFPPVRTCGLAQSDGAAEGGGDADGRRAADDHDLKGGDNVGSGAAEEAFLAGRQLSLIEEVEDNAVPVKNYMIFHVFSCLRVFRQAIAREGLRAQSRAGGLKWTDGPSAVRKEESGACAPTPAGRDAPQAPERKRDAFRIFCRHMSAAQRRAGGRAYSKH